MSENLLSITAADCDWEYMRGTGPGGQKRNKTSSKVRCVHRASKATGESDETRSQHQNKRLAFKKMAESAAFKKWLRLEVSKRIGTLNQVNETVDNMMHPSYIRTEVKQDGLWKEAEIKEEENGNGQG